MGGRRDAVPPSTLMRAFEHSGPPGPCVAPTDALRSDPIVCALRSGRGLPAGPLPDQTPERCRRIRRGSITCFSYLLMASEPGQEDHAFCPGGSVLRKGPPAFSVSVWRGPGVFPGKDGSENHRVCEINRPTLVPRPGGGAFVFRTDWRVTAREKK